MSIIEVKTPTMGESITEATIAEIRKGNGVVAAKDDVVMVLETDKVALEVVMPENGRIQSINVKLGDDVRIGDVLFIINTDATQSKISNSNKHIAKDEQLQNIKSVQQNFNQTAASKHNEETDGPRQEVLECQAEGRNAEAGFVSDNSPEVEKVASGSEQKGEEGAADSGGAVVRSEEKIKMSRLRSRIAERLKQAQNTAAILTTFNEIDMSCLLALKEKYKEAFFRRHQLKLGLMSFFVKAATLALKEVPIVNASVEGDYIIRKEYCDIGVAVGTEKGLVVPIIRNAERMRIVELEKQLRHFIDKSRNGLLQITDLTGGTFSITNGGVYGSLLSTPIINPPQSAILGMHAIKERPIALEGRVVIRPMMYVALSYDHRIVDGHEAVLFLSKVKSCIEDCSCMLIDI